MTLTQAQLRRAVSNVFAGRIDEFVASFNQWAIPMGIDTPLRVSTSSTSQRFGRRSRRRWVLKTATSCSS